MGAFALAVAGGLLIVPSSAAAPAPPAAFTGSATGAAEPCQVTLPGGLKATVTGNAGQRTARLTDPAQAKEAVTTYWSGGHQYLMPASAATAPRAAADPSAYDVTALADRTCGTGAERAAPAAGNSVRHGYRMARLTIDARDGASRPATKGKVLLADLDHNTYVRRSYDISTGVLRLVVPAGRYAALFTYPDSEGGELTYRIALDPEFTVRDGSRVTLDAAAATVPVEVPSTPRPATLVGRSFSVYRGDGSGLGAEHGLWFQMQWPPSATARLQVNPGAGPVAHGRFSVVTTFDYASPDGAAQPYAYHLAQSADRTPARFLEKVDPATLATVRRSYAGAEDTGTPMLAVHGAAPVWAARTRELAATGYEFFAPGTVRTEYYSALPDVSWSHTIEDAARRVDIESGRTVYRRGGRTTETVGAGALHPNSPLAAPDTVTYCGACADGTSLLFALRPDGDNTPGDEGLLTSGETNTVTLTRDGEPYATGDTGLDQASVPVPAGRARYALRLATRRSTPGTRLSPGTDTTWTFTADPGRGRNVPANVLCPASAAKCTALPLLYAYTNTDADPLNRVAPGRHTLTLRVARQQYAAAGTVTGADVSVSYDDGAHWKPLRVRGAAGDFTADYTVPSDASGHTVSFRLSARDSTGSRVDQELPGAYLVP
ncbi:hypothetical protein ACIGZH_22635 [Streptomyces sp. NPDC058319]|uniref:hypothetical protein n=1 Tax=unclassified Streptomyces TaxID=2593676 RepID=UPI0036E9B323